MCERGTLFGKRVLLSRSPLLKTFNGDSTLSLKVFGKGVRGENLSSERFPPGFFFSYPFFGSL